MSVVFDYLQRRLAEFGSSYWKNNSFDIRLVNKTTIDIDHSALDYTLSNLVEVSGANYLPKKSTNNTVSQFDNGRIVYTFDDVVWESSSVSSDGVLVTNGQFPLIFIDFGYRRLSENGNFEIQWGDDGLIYLETGNEAVSSTSTDTSISYSGIESGNNLGGGTGLYAGVSNKTINFKSVVSDKWIIVSSTDNEIKFGLNQDFVVAGDNVKIKKNNDGSVTISANDSGNNSVLPNEVEYKLDKHIADSVIHVTQEDKDKWNAPISWDDLEDKPTTVSELGITNVYTKTEVDNLIDDSEVSWDDIDNKPNTVSGFGITDVYTKTEVDTAISNIDVNVDWSEIDNKPTTVSGFGITDVYTKTEVDTHTNDTVIHVTQEDKDKWNTVDIDYVYYVGTVGDTAVTLTHNLNTEDYEVSYVDMETKSNLALIAEQKTNSVVIEDLSPLTMNQQLKIILRLFNKRYSDVPPTIYSLLLLDVAEVSMLCVDGSDGKNNLFYLEAIFSDGNNHQTSANWSSSDPSVATVDSYGYVRGVSNGGEPLGKDVTISCSWEGVVKSCLFTVYATMPSADVNGAGLWLCKGGSGGRSSNATTTSIAFLNANKAPYPEVNSMRVHVRSLTPGASIPIFTIRNTVGLGAKLQINAGPAIKLTGEKITGTSVTSFTETSSRPAPASLDPTIIDSTIYVGGTAVGTTSDTATHSSENLIYLPFAAYVHKIVQASAGINATQADLRSRQVSLQYSPQNYVRYTDRMVDGTAWVNRTSVPNIGTLGNGYDLIANNVPALWYQV